MGEFFELAERSLSGSFTRGAVEIVCGGMLTRCVEDLYQDDAAIEATAVSTMTVTITAAGLMIPRTGTRAFVPARSHSFSKRGTKLCSSSDSSENSA